VAGTVLGVIVTSSFPPPAATALTTIVGRGLQADGVVVEVGVGVTGATIVSGIGVAVLVCVAVVDGTGVRVAVGDWLPI
jgi:hypothetical protein